MIECLCLTQCVKLGEELEITRNKRVKDRENNKIQKQRECEELKTERM